MILRWSRGIRCTIILIIIFLSEHLLLLGQTGQTGQAHQIQIKAAGQILIPTADGQKPYRAVITIRSGEILIECSIEIFQPFNKFDTPKQEEIKVNTAEVEKICIQGKQKKEILILPKEPLYKRYRHLFHPVERITGYIPYSVEKKDAIIFIMDNPADIGSTGERLIKSINKTYSTYK